MFFFLLYYVRHPSFPRLIEKIVNARLENEITIGGVSLQPGRVIVTDITVKDVAKEEDEEVNEEERHDILVVPRAEITYTPRELLNKTIDTITVTEPKLTLTARGKPSKDASAAPVRIPFTFRKASIKAGDLTIRMPHGAIRMLFNATLGSSTETGRQVFQGRGDFDKVSVSGEERLAVLEQASGELDASFTLSDDLLSGELRAEARITTPQWKATEPHRASLQASYDDTAGRLTVEQGTFSSPVLGTLDVGGSLESFPSDHTHYDLHGTATDISLGSIHRLILLPLNLSAQVLELDGLWTGSLHMQGSRNSEITWETTHVIKDLGFSLASGRLDLATTPLHLSSRGSYAPKTDRVKFNPWTVRLGEGASGTLTGTFTGVSSGDPALDLLFQGKDISVTQAAAGLSELTTAWPDWLEIDGSGSADLQIQGHLHTPKIKALIDLQGKGLNLAGVRLTPFQARLPVAFEKGAYTLEDAVLRGNHVVLPLGGSGGMDLTLSKGALHVPRARIEGARVESPSIRLEAAAASLGKNKGSKHREEAVMLQGDLRNDPDEGRLALEGFSLDTAGLKGVAGTLYFDWKDGRTVVGQINAEKLNVETLGQRYGRYLPPLNQLQLKGKGSFRSRFAAALTGASPLINGNVEMTVTEGGFAFPDATRAAEGAAVSLTGRFNVLPARNEVELKLDGLATGFELLWGRFYGDFSQKTIHLSLASRYDGTGDVLSLSHGRLSMADLGRLSLTGKIHDLTGTPVFESELRVEDFSNKGAYDLFIRETFQESLPFLSELEMAGSGSALLVLRGTPDRFQAAGRIGVKGMNVTSRDLDLTLTGLTLDLPVQVSYPANGGLSYPEDFGALTLANFSLHGVAVENVRIAPALWQNALVIRDDLSIPLLGGRMILKDILYENLPYPNRKLTLSIIPEQFDLARLSAALGMPRFNGVLSGVIPRARFEGRRLSTEGEIRLSLFGGEMRIGEISVDNIFSPAASVKSSIEIEAIDLSQLTDTFEFGHISGILQGYVKDLEVVNGQPAAFEGLLETVKRKGVEQRISVQALEKITILGSGATPSLFGRGIYSLFKEYRYSKMGFKSRLRNDNFQVRGIEVIGDREYLVVGSLLPPKVNVINYTQNISFKQMLERLKRLETAGSAETR